MQKTTLKVTMENGKVLSDMGLILPCAVEELGCETTSLDPYAYIRDYLDNCVFSMFRTEVSMVKQGTKYYVISGKDSTSKFGLMSRIIHKNMVENPHPFTQQITIRYIWHNSVMVSIWKPEEILAAR